MTIIEKLILLTIILILLGLPLAPYFEAKTYNKLTGANATWWDAIWVELRVQDTPKSRTE